jgi:hypothetical protein
MTKTKPAIKGLLKKAQDLGFDPNEQDIIDTGPQIQPEERTAVGESLKDHQRLMLIQWIAQGLTNKQINSRAAKYVDPFHVGSEIIYYYRTYKQLDITAMRRLQESNAFNTGLALRAQRIEHLDMIAKIVYNHLVNEDGMWVTRLKQLGRNGPIIEETEFNDAEVKEFRMLLGDIASEVGQRVHRLDVTSQGQHIKGYATVSPDDWDTPVEGSVIPDTKAPELPATTTPPAEVTPISVDFVPLDPFAKDAPAGATMFPRPKKSPKTTPEKTAKAVAAAKNSNKAQAKRKNVAKPTTNNKRRK